MCGKILALNTRCFVDKCAICHNFAQLLVKIELVNEEFIVKN